MALRRAMPDAPADIALAAGKAPALIPDAAARSLTAIAAARREANEDAQRAATAIFIAEVAGIASVVHAVRPPQTTMLSIGSRRRAPIEAADGSVAFADIVTATLVMRSRRGRYGARRRAACNLQGICRTACYNAGVILGAGRAT